MGAVGSAASESPSGGPLSFVGTHSGAIIMYSCDNSPGIGAATPFMFKSELLVILIGFSIEIRLHYSFLEWSKF